MNVKCNLTGWRRHTTARQLFIDVNTIIQEKLLSDIKMVSYILKAPLSLPCSTEGSKGNEALMRFHFFD